MSGADKVPEKAKQLLLSFPFSVPTSSLGGHRLGPKLALAGWWFPGSLLAATTDPVSGLLEFHQHAIQQTGSC